MENLRSRALIQKFIMFTSQAPVWIIFILGLWLVVLSKFGPSWAFVPGDLGDGRLNNYILEHFFLWITGTVREYWNAPFFYPYPNVIAFSDNLLGSAPLYAIFRGFGLGRETSFQWWYLFSFVFNYVSAAYVLLQEKFRPLAVGLGAFFFTFGIPLLAQETHPQLFYRFAVPLACFSLFKFFNQPKMTHLAALAFWLTWQLYLSIYLGVFLVILVATLVFLIPLFETDLTLQERLPRWPQQIKRAWLKASIKERTFSLLAISGTGICFFALLWPYYKVTIDYGFSRNWSTVSAMLPVPQSFLLADNSLIWKSFSAHLSDMAMRHENQLFPGLAISIMVISGLVGRFNSKNRRAAWAYFGAILLIVLITTNINGFSIYWLFWKIPGINSLRAISRIQLILMWPLAFFSAWVMNELFLRAQQKTWLYAIMFVLLGLLFAESTLFTQVSYLKANGISRLVHLKQTIPTNLPKNPILAVAYTGNEPDYLTEIDVMLTAQELGWPTTNGYSGNFPQGYNLATSCEQIPNQIKKYFKAVNMDKEKRLIFYLSTMNRIVPVGFGDCDPIWWKRMP